MEAGEQTCPLKPRAPLCTGLCRASHMSSPGPHSRHCDPQPSRRSNRLGANPGKKKPRHRLQLLFSDRCMIVVRVDDSARLSTGEALLSPRKSPCTRWGKRLICIYIAARGLAAIIGVAQRPPPAPPTRSHTRVRTHRRLVLSNLKAISISLLL